MNRPEKFLLFLLILLLPSQLAFHFWPSWSLVYGVRVDYLSPTLYFTDLLIIGLFFSSRLRVRVSLPVIIFIVLNALNSSLPLLTIYKWLRVLEYYWLYKYLINYYKLKTMNSALSLSILWTSVLTWMQFFKQSSIGGVAWWLGERTFSVSTPGIAKIAISYWPLAISQVLRPYATLPHPNALAGFLLVSGLIIYFQKTQSKKLLSIAALTVPITFSRMAIALEILILLIWIKPLIFKILLLFSGFYFLVSFTGSSDSLPIRLTLTQSAISAIQKSPLLGVGLGNFIPSTLNSQLSTLNSIRQPVHNIYLLLASELGLPATLVISYWLIVHSRRLLRTKNYQLTTAAAVIAITGAADHYWLTLHQNILLLILLLSLIKIKSSTNSQL